MITYSNSDTSTAYFLQSYGNIYSSTGSGTSLASSTAVTTDFVATLDDDAPTLAGLFESVARHERRCQTVFESGPTVIDTDDDNLEKAIVRISAGFETGEDVLAATVGSIGLTATYTASTGTLEITGTLLPNAQYQEVLRTVTQTIPMMINRVRVLVRLFGSCLMGLIIHLPEQRMSPLRLPMMLQLEPTLEQRWHLQRRCSKCY